MDKIDYSKKNGILISIQGGLGKNISFLNIIDEVREKYGDIGIITPYTDVFDYQKNVTVYNPNNVLEVKDAFRDFSKGKIVIDHMYDLEDFIKKELTYADAWRVLCNLPKKDGKNITKVEKSNLIIPEVCVNAANQILKDLQENGKEFIIFQHTGGQSPLVQVPLKDGKEDWSQVPYTQKTGLSRHYPTNLAQEFVDKIKDKYEVVSYTLPNEPYLEGTKRYAVPYLTYHELAKNAKAIVTIDSSLQHMTAGLNIPTIVLWAHSDPHTFGYENNMNIVQECNREDIHYFTALGPSYNKVKYIEPDELAKKLDELLSKKEE